MYYDIPEKDWADIIFGDFLTGALKNYVYIEYNDDLFTKLN